MPLPGGAPERLTPLIDQKTKRPVPLVPLAEKLRKASTFAVETLRNDLFVPAVVPQPPVGRGWCLEVEQPLHNKAGATTPARGSGSNPASGSCRPTSIRCANMFRRSIAKSSLHCSGCKCSSQRATTTRPMKNASPTWWRCGVRSMRRGVEKQQHELR